VPSSSLRKITLEPFKTHPFLGLIINLYLLPSILGTLRSSGNTSTSKTISTNTSSYVNVVVNGEIVASIKVTKNSQNYCVLAYNNTTYPSASTTVTTSISQTLTNNLYYIK